MTSFRQNALLYVKPYLGRCSDCQATPAIRGENYALKQGGSSQRCVKPKKVDFEVERRFQAHSQYLGGVKMEMGFCSEGSKHGEDVIAYSIPVRSVCQESVWMYGSVVESFKSGNGRFR